MSEYNERSVITIPSDRSILFIDSKYRFGVDDYPTHFSCYLSSGVTAKAIQYRNLNWSTPLYTHNTSNNEIRFRVENNDDLTNPTYVAYIMPWIIFKEFSGLTTPGFNPPATGSYAKEVEVALNDYRLLNDNTNSQTVPPITVNGKAVSFFCEYNKCNGFLIYALDADNDGISFQILDCNWIEKAYNVHGFGVYDAELDSMRPKNAANSDIYYTSYLSDALPLLTVSKYFTIYCEQLSRERRLPSFKNVDDDEGNGDEAFSMEFGVFPILLDQVGKYSNYEASTDPTTVSVRDGSEAQYISIYMVNSENNLMKCGHAFQRFMEDETVPFSIRAKAWDPLSNYRTPAFMDFLLFGGHSIYGNTTINSFALLDHNNFNNTFSVLDILDYNSTIRTYPHAIAGVLTDTSGGWIAYNTSLIQKMNQRRSSMVITCTFELIGTENPLIWCICRPYFRLRDRTNNSILVEVIGSATMLSNDPFGTLYPNTYTIPYTSLLNGVIGRDYYAEHYVKVVTTGLSGLTTLFSLAGHSAGKSITVTSTGTLFSPGYVDPKTITKYGKPDEMCLCDELSHQFDVVY